MNTLLRDLGLKGKDIMALLESVVIADQLDTEKLSRSLEKYQPFPLYEDVEVHIQHLRCRLALRNLSHTDLQTTLISRLPASCQQEEAIHFLTSLDLNIRSLAAKRVVNFLWKGEMTIQISDLDLSVLPTWERLDDIIKRMRLHLAANNQHLADVSRLIPIPLTAIGLDKALFRSFGLNTEQSFIIVSHLFPNPTAHSVTHLSTILAPPWMTQSELEIPKRLEELALYMDTNTLSQIGEMTIPVSNEYISLIDFEVRCEQTFQRHFTSEQKAALELLCYEDTRMLDALSLSHFHCALRDVMLKLGDFPPVPPLDLE